VDRTTRICKHIFYNTSETSKNILKQRENEAENLGSSSSSIATCIGVVGVMEIFKCPNFGQNPMGICFSPPHSQGFSPFWIFDFYEEATSKIKNCKNKKGKRLDVSPLSTSTSQKIFCLFTLWFPEKAISLEKVDAKYSKSRIFFISLIINLFAI